MGIGPSDDSIQANGAPGWRHLQDGWREAAILLAAALIFRFPTLGDPNLHVDESFYFMVGQAMHDGLVPYIDIWDRKPFGLFALYFTFAAFSDSVLAYQIPALFCASATAFLLAKIARLWLTGWGPTMAGISYLAMLHPLDGFGGQGPVFYNLLIAGAAWLILSGWHAFDRQRFLRRYFGAMLLCALALTIKQTTVFEAIFFGLAGLYRLHRDGVSAHRIAKVGAIAIAIGLAPSALIAGWYAAHGWIDEWWHAMFASNFARQSLGLVTQTHNFYAVFRLIAVFLGCALLGLIFQRGHPEFKRYRGLMLWWLGAAFLGVAVIANAFTHYLLPLLVPLTPLAAMAYAKRLVGPVLFAVTIVVAAILGSIFQFGHYRASQASFWQTDRVIRENMDEGRLLLFHGYPLLYATTGAQPMSPLAFPNHLYDPLERDVSHLDTYNELQRVFAARPEVVMIRTRLGVRGVHLDPDIRALVTGYIAANCKAVWEGELREPRRRRRAHTIYACE